LLRQFISSPWFALAELVTVLLSGLIWMIRPEAGLWLLLVVLFPWGLRLVSGVSPFPRTQFDGFLAVFVITAEVGYWAAYNEPAAWGKFWLIIGTIFLYYALIAQPEENLVHISNILCGIGIGVAVYFLLAPNVTAHPGYVSGIVLLTGLFVFYRFRGEEKTGNQSSALSKVAAYLGLGILIYTLAITITRGLLVSIFSVFGVWLIWKVWGSTLAFTKDKLRSRFPLFVLIYLGLVMIFVHIGQSEIGLRFPSLIKFGNDTRVELFDRSAYFLADFPITGGGLNSFPGLYSNYILGIPHFYFVNSYNVFLDVAIEQGLVGGLVLIFLYFAGIWNSCWVVVHTKSPNVRTFSWLALIALVIAMVHGMMYDYLYNGVGTFLLLFPVGASMLVMRLAAQEKNEQRTRKTHSPEFNDRMIVISLFIIAGLVIGLWTGGTRKLKAIWYSNLGAVQLAQAELDGFPDKGWVGDEIVPKLGKADASLHSSLQLDPDNQTANHRLGLVYMFRRDFESASIYLKRANDQAPNHRGIIKSLGYCYLWLGEYDKAWFLLAQIPEAREELDVYTWWWGTQGREDLSEKASMMLSELSSATIP